MKFAGEAPFTIYPRRIPLKRRRHHYFILLALQWREQVTPPVLKINGAMVSEALFLLDLCVWLLVWHYFGDGVGLG